MLEKVKSHPLTKESDINTSTTYKSLEEIVNDAKLLGCDAIVNCSGLGAASLCDDSSTVGGRGALLHYNRTCERRVDFTRNNNDKDACILTEEGEWGTFDEPCYMIPRGDVLVIGGSCKENNLETDILEDERNRLEKNAWNLGVDTKKATPVDSWVGWRPIRPQMRVEVDTNLSTDEITLVHSYGAGGSGWTTFTGIAKENVKLVLQGLMK